MHSAEMRRVVLTGKMAAGLAPHVCALLEDASVQLLARVVEQLHIEEGLARVELWSRLRVLASRLQCLRELWA
jgi:hypothetical protein